MLLVTLLCVYLFYMFKIFKTSISFNHPLEYILTNNSNNYFYHPISSENYENKICPFGKDIIILLIIVIILKYLFKKLNYLSMYILIITFIISLMNFNSTVYLIPFFIFEIYNLTYNGKYTY